MWAYHCFPLRWQWRELKKGKVKTEGKREKNTKTEGVTEEQQLAVITAKWRKVLASGNMLLEDFKYDLGYKTPIDDQLHHHVHSNWWL